MMARGLWLTILEPTTGRSLPVIAADALPGSTTTSSTLGAVNVLGRY